jgi:8-oxo-dGTP pyrophosphatase MutT (NUDIX family)
MRHARSKTEELVTQLAQKAVVLDEHGSVLLVSRMTCDGHFLQWELPGGRIQRGEYPDGFDASLVREVWEEVGLVVEPGEPLLVWALADTTAITVIARRVRSYSGHCTIENRPPGEHLGEFRWFPADCLPEAMAQPFRDAIAIAVHASRGYR